MSNENKVITENEQKCFCQSKVFKKFLVVALGTFVGVYAALSLFAATHRPPVGFGFGAPGPIFGPCPCQALMIHQHHHKKPAELFDKNIPNPDRKTPFEAQKNRDVDD